MPRKTKTRPKKSFVWEAFSKIDVNSVKCNSCHSVYKVFGTTNLIKHLKRKHPVLYLELSECPLRKSLPDLSCTGVSDLDPNVAELRKIETETDHSYVGLHVETISQYQYDETKMFEDEEVIEIPTSRIDCLIHEEQIEELNIEKLIEQVRLRPLLWDMTLDEYKDKAGKSEAWVEVVKAICETFEEKSNAEKIIIVQDAKLKWKSLRNGFLRRKRRDYQTTQNGRKHKMYMYLDQLQFLVPNVESRLTEPPTTVRSPRKSHSDRNCTEVDPNEGCGPSLIQMCDSEDILLESKVDFVTQSRRHCDEGVVTKSEQQEESEVESVKTLSEDEQFFNSMLSSVATLSDPQKLQFRIDVMQALVRAKRS